MKETKNRKISARVNESTYQIIKDSEFSFSEALEWFAGNLTSQDNRKYIQLKLLEEEKTYLEKKLQDNELGILELKEEIGEKNITGKEYNKPVMKAVQSALNYYNRKLEIYHNIEDFLETENSYLLQTATRCNLEIDELKDLILNKYNETKNQTVLI